MPYLYFLSSNRIQYHYWGKTDCGKENFQSTALEMFRKGGFRPFLVGATATVVRDIIFGGTYAVMRHQLAFSTKPNSFRDIDVYNYSINLFSACIATVFSSPLNYARNIHYSTPPHDRASTIVEILKDLLKESKSHPSHLDRAKFLQARLRIGWGTARVGLGMAFGAQIYKMCRNVHVGI